VKSHAVLIASAVAVGAVAFMLASGDRGGQPAGLALRPEDPAVVKRGAQIYEAHCASCHGARLEGQPDWRERNSGGLLPAPPHDASGHTWHHPDEVLFRITKYGVATVAQIKDYRTAMPVYDGVLSDEEIVAVLSWIKAQWPEGIRRRHDEIDAEHRKSGGAPR
jgi:S-disulfanyl-L-cysteine oxidoreductase SoxD